MIINGSGTSLKDLRSPDGRFLAISVPRIEQREYYDLTIWDTVIVLYFYLK